MEETTHVNGAPAAALTVDDPHALTAAQQKFFKERVFAMQDLNGQIRGALGLIVSERGLPGEYGLSDDQARLVLQQQQAKAPAPTQ